MEEKVDNQTWGKAKEISVMKAVYNMGLNPENVIYTRNSTSQRTTSNIRWTIYSPFQTLGLLPLGQQELTLELTKQSMDGNGGNVANANWGGLASGYDKVSLKEGFPLANSTDSASLTLNGDVTNFNRVRDWMKELSMCFVGNKTKNCAIEGGRWWNLDGLYPTFGTNLNEGNLDRDALVPKHDNNLFNNEQEFIAKMAKTNGDAIAASQTQNYLYTEPIVIPPFNPFWNVIEDKSIPRDVWFKRMTKSIPHVDRLDYSLNLSNMTPSMFFNRLGHHAVNDNRVTNISITDISQANLVLYWYRYPDKMSIPRELDISSWYVRTYPKAIGVVNDGINGNETTDYYELYTVPDYIFINCKRDQSNADYVCRSPTARDAVGNENRVSATTSNNSMDNYLQIESIDIQIGDKNNIINTSMTQEELYNITLKNINHEDFPYDYQKWRGRKTFAPSAVATPNVANQLLNYPSRCVLVFRPKDLGIRLSPGVVTPLTIKISNLNYRAFSGFPSTFTSNNSYNLNVTAFYSNYGISIQDGLFRTFEKNFNSLAPNDGMGPGVGGSLRRRGDGSVEAPRINPALRGASGAYISRQ